MDIKKEQSAKPMAKEDTSKLTDEQLAKLDELWKQGENNSIFTRPAKKTSA